MLKLSNAFSKKYQYPSNSGFKLRLEARFWVAASLCLTFYLIASNIGSGWIYLICSALLSALLLGILLSFVNILAVQASQNIAHKVTAGASATVLIKLERWQHRTTALFLQFPQYLRLGYTMSSGSSGPPGTTYGGNGSNNKKTAIVEWLAGKQEYTWQTEPLRRGVHPPGTIIIDTCFPLGLAWWQRRFAPESIKNKSLEPEKTITAYPKEIAIDGYLFFRLRRSSPARGGLSRSSSTVRQSTSTRGIREYLRGDSPRHIHWASSARSGRLLVREFEAEGLPEFDVLLDLAAPWSSEEQFELAVTAANSLLALGHRLGTWPELFLNAPTPELGKSFHFPGRLPDCLPGIETQREILARVQPLMAPRAASNSSPINVFFNPSDTYSPERVLIVIHPLNKNANESTYENAYFIFVEDVSISGNHQKTNQFQNNLIHSVIANEKDLSQL